MGIIAWIIVGALAGWIASIVMKTNAEQGAVANVVIGIIGALIGGFLMRLFGIDGITGLNFSTLLVATLGAVILIGVLRAAHRV